MRHGDIFELTQDEDRGKRKYRECQASAPILNVERSENTDQQQTIADEVKRKLREEGGKLGHITVDAFDQFAGCMVVVEAHIEVQRMPGKFGAQGIGRSPGDVFTQVGHTDCHHLLHQCNPNKCQCSKCESL